LPLAVEAKKIWKLSTWLERTLGQTRRSLHPHRPTLIAVTHDCSRTGAPLILLELLRVWRQHHDFSLVVLSLQSGPLDDDFRALADELLFTPDSPPVLSRKSLEILQHETSKWGETKDLRVLLNSAVSGELASTFGVNRIPITALVHEFADSILPLAKYGLYHHAQRIIFPSRIVRSSFLKLFATIPALPDRVPELHVMPQGLFPHFLKPFEKDANLRTSAGIPADAFVVLGMGTRDWRKGIDLFVMAADLMVRRRHADDREVHFVYVGSEAPWMPYAQPYTLHAIDMMGLENRVHFVDAVSDSRPWFAAADAFFMSSRVDPYPCVVLEAMAAGLPVVLFEGGAGSAEFIAEHGGGEVVPHLDVGAAAAVLERWASEGTADLGREAAEAVRAEAEWGAYAERVWSAMHNDKRGKMAN